MFPIFCALIGERSLNFLINIFAESFTQFLEDQTKIEKLITSDAQTSGGLLISISPEKTESFLQLFNEQSSIKAREIGKITKQREKAIFLT